MDRTCVVGPTAWARYEVSPHFITRLTEVNHMERPQVVRVSYMWRMYGCRNLWPRRKAIPTPAA